LTQVDRRRTTQIKLVKCPKKGKKAPSKSEINDIKLTNDWKRDYGIT